MEPRTSCMRGGFSTPQQDLSGVFEHALHLSHAPSSTLGDSKQWFHSSNTPVSHWGKAALPLNYVPSSCPTAFDDLYEGVRVLLEDRMLFHGLHSPGQPIMASLVPMPTMLGLGRSHLDLSAGL